MYDECIRHRMQGRCHRLGLLSFMLQILCLFLWRHLENISALLLRRCFLSAFIILNFSCRQRLHRFIKKHNSRVLLKSRSNTEVTACNCLEETCPLPGNCLVPNVIYKAKVTTTNDMTKKHYIGMTAGPFKLRYNNHKKSFRNPQHAKDTVHIYVYVCIICMYYIY